MKKIPAWKPYCSLLAALLIPAAANADVVLDWNLIMQTTVSSQTPFPQARFAAITQLAVFEAVNAITGDYKPYLGTITAPRGASAEAAAIAAAHAVLKNYFPANAPALDAAYTMSLATIPAGSARDAGVSVGEAAAAAMIANRANDGSSPAKFYLPTSSSPGVWQLTPSCTPAGGAFFHWQNVTPFGIRSADQFRLDPPPALSSGRYARTYNEVKDVGAINSTDRPQDRADVVHFYAAVAATGVFNPVFRQLSATHKNSLSENAHDLALLNMAINDAAVATFDAKYFYNFWRPETAIHNGDLDGNGRTDPDPAFAPFIVTPCFPSYPSAHGTLSNAARAVLERAFGNVRQAMTLSDPAAPGIVLHYTRLEQITDDISDARVYGGIHFRTDQDAGESLGIRLGQYVYEHNLRRVHGNDHDDRN
ncbi:MAG TPA: vanadium-dependent haloperoxidase [Bryobacteraceae bacterium]|jgi:hypothetical protein